MVDQRGVTPSEDSIGDALKQAASATGATPLTSMEGKSVTWMFANSNRC